MSPLLDYPGGVGTDEPEGGFDFPAAPGGVYMVRCTDANVVDRKSGMGSNLAITVSIEAPETEQHGVNVRTWLTIPTTDEMKEPFRKNKAGEMVTVGMLMIRRINEAMRGFSLDPRTAEASHMVGKVTQVELGVEQYEGRDQNRIVRYL